MDQLIFNFFNDGSPPNNLIAPNNVVVLPYDNGKCIYATSQ